LKELNPIDGGHDRVDQNEVNLLGCQHAHSLERIRGRFGVNTGLEQLQLRDGQGYFIVIDV